MPTHTLRRFRMGAVAVALCSMSLLAFGGAGSAPAQAATVVHTHAVQDPPPNGNNGTTIDPLQYNVSIQAPD